jgi:DNA helicase HerA-like ATPase
MVDNKLVQEMIADLSNTRQNRNAIIDLNEDELTAGLENQVQTLKKWIQTSGSQSKAQLFAKRTPIGTIITHNKRLDSCYVLQASKSENRPAMNQFVLIYDQKYDDIVSGIVENFKPFKTSKKGEEGLIIVIDLLFSHNDVTLRKRKHISQLISDDCLVFNVTPDEIQKIYGIPETGVNLGICSHNGDIINTKVGGPLYYLLKPELLKTHMMIGGVTGQGKTIFLKNMIYDLAVHDFEVSNNMVVFDLQGDLVQMLEPMPEKMIGKDFKELYKDLDIKEFTGLKQKITNDDSLFLKPFYVKVHGFLEMFPWTDFGLNSANIETGEELVSLLPNLTKQGSQTIIQLYSMFMLERETLFKFEEFYQFVINGVSVNERGIKNYRWSKKDESDSIEAPRSVADAVIRQLKVLQSLQVFDKVPEMNVDTLLNKRLVFIYFPDYQGYTQVRSIMLLDLLSRIYYMKRENIDKAIKNNLIVIDEAHELLPKRRKDSDLSDEFFKFIEKRFTRVAKEGRKYGMSLIITSQILSELNDEVKSNAQTRVFFKLSEKDLKDLDLDKDTKYLVDGLKKGYAVVYSRDNLDVSRATEIKVMPPVFLHCDPREADKYFESAVEEIKQERKKLETKKSSKN